MEIIETTCRTALIQSQIPGVNYALNAYRGCGHACRYCYMRIVGRESIKGRGEWGSFADARINTPRLLLKELARRRRGRIMLSSGTDCYQPIEGSYRLTRTCLEIIRDARFPASILTKSALVTRDIDVFAEIRDLEIGVTITTDREDVRAVMEPGASRIAERLDALRVLYDAGLKPQVFIGPVLPMDPGRLAELIGPWTSYVYLDPLNYPSLVEGLLRRRGWGEIMEQKYAADAAEVFRQILGKDRVESLC